ncbi:hypothetical protein EGW08_001291 [Elysia chlorotica]|uniref:Lipase domain-containing protein n=1 Tax=Elysia chlorotica TaxID=188477 RepID=A0A433UAX9_ELYCH|nr:hypothetical protein EGW08_001291 [Elysia chlorotica]
MSACAQTLDILNFKTEFFLYTKGLRGREALFTNDRNSIRNSRFDPCRKTAFLITGWFQPRGDLRIVTFAETLASKRFNAIIVDFFTFDYFLSPLIAGGDIAKFLAALVDVTGVDPKSIQLLGISMGVHVAGQASRQFRVGRITDLGSINPYVGHVNYVINDAITQPGCPDMDESIELCYHLRAAYLYLASLDKCTIYFKQCGSYIAFRLGLCRDRSNLAFGFALEAKDAPRNGRLYWYSTKRDVYPFCNRADQIAPKIPSRICRRSKNETAFDSEETPN